MKNLIRIIALLMVAVFALTLLVGCGKSMDSIKDKIKDLDDCDFEKIKGSDFEDEFSDGGEFDIEINDVDKAYYVESEDDGFAIVVEFEKSADAKTFYKDMKAEFEDYIEYINGDYDEDDFSIKMSGKIVILGNNDLIEEIW